MNGNHEDYHAMWIDPNEPEHYIIGGDAGIFQTWDRGGTYDALNQMPMAQFYAVSFDFQVPYRVCGGMQDNGSSCGISRRRGGTLQMTDWFAVGGADGFYTAQDPTDPNFVYYESQGGNMTRRNLLTGETANLKPRTVAIGTYGAQITRARGDASKPATPAQEQEIAQIRQRMKDDMANPQVALRWNWNVPFMISQHDPNVFYSGSEKVWKSVKRGSNPVAISPDLSTQDPDRLRMAQGYDAEGNVAADVSGGITNDAAAWLAEQHGTIVSLNESPIRAGILFAGTDDGNVWTSRNDGYSWDGFTSPGRFPGLPPKTYVSRIEPSHFDSATFYVAFDNHRENDFKPYIYVTNDWGRTFRSIASNLPTTGPNYVYVIREDPTNANVLFAGTETGVFTTIDKGASWFKLDGNLPVVPVYDLKIHPRDHELIAGTHGRAIQILDVAPLEQLADALKADTYLFAPTTAFEFTQPPSGSEPRSQRGWRGESAPYGADIAYRLATPAQGPARILIVNAVGDTILSGVGPANAGINHVVWNFQPGQAIAAAGAGIGGGRGAGGRGGQVGPVDVAGFPAGFDPRPAESRAAPDSSQVPTIRADTTATSVAAAAEPAVVVAAAGTRRRWRRSRWSSREPADRRLRGDSPDQWSHAEANAACRGHDRGGAWHNRVLTEGCQRARPTAALKASSSASPSTIASDRTTPDRAGRPT